MGWNILKKFERTYVMMIYLLPQVLASVKLHKLPLNRSLLCFPNPPFCNIVQLYHFPSVPLNNKRALKVRDRLLLHNSRRCYQSLHTLEMKKLEGANAAIMK